MVFVDYLYGSPTRRSASTYGKQDAKAEIRSSSIRLVSKVAEVVSSAAQFMGHDSRSHRVCVTDDYTH
jgi:hypothetical protein